LPSLRSIWRGDSFVTRESRPPASLRVMRGEACGLKSFGGTPRADPLSRPGVASAQGAGRAVSGQFSRAFYVLGIHRLQAHLKLDLPHAFGRTRSIGFHLAARGTHDLPGAMGVGVGKRVLAQILFSDARLIGAGVGCWKRADLAGHGDLPKTRLDVERVGSSGHENSRPYKNDTGQDPVSHFFPLGWDV